VNVLSTQRCERAALPTVAQTEEWARGLGVQQQLRGRNAALSGTLLQRHKVGMDALAWSTRPELLALEV